MYQSSYAEILEDSADISRGEEQKALDRAIDLLHAAKGSAPRSEAETRALNYLMQLWGFFIKMLASPENDLPKGVRANLISVGLGVMSEANRIERGHSRDFDSLAEICVIVRDALA